MGADNQDVHDLAALRHDYAAGGLDEADLAADPVTMFQRWFADARAGGLREPNAMVVSTVSSDLRPSSRTVLLKGIGPDGFRFFTNLGSRKGAELATNHHCALLFPWHDLERQVRVEGTATLISRDDVGAYFASRPRGSQLGAWASSQSQQVADRAALESSYDEAERRFPDEVPVPEGWGGYLVRPDVVEFWQGRTGRLHDRLVYRRTADAGWNITRLAP